DEKAEGERAGRHTPVPAELVEDGRKEQRERRARVDAEPHGDEDDSHDDPAVIKAQAHERGFYRQCHGEAAPSWEREQHRVFASVCRTPRSSAWASGCCQWWPAHLTCQPTTARARTRSSSASRAA